MNDFPIKIYVYTFCYNELSILPFVVDYWKKYATRVIVYDNFSTDGSDRYLSQFDFIEVRKYNTKGQFNPKQILELKNKCWLECRGKNIDYVQICDLDEVIYDEHDIISKLQDIKQAKSTIVLSNYYELISEKVPNYNGELMAHEFPTSGAFLQAYIKKPILFNPNCLTSIHFNDWGRTAKVTGNVNYYRTCINVLHLKMLGGAQYVRHNQELNNRCCVKDYTYFYGSNFQQAAYIMSNIRNSNPIINRAMLSVNDNTKVKLSNFHDVEWDEDTQYVQGSNHINNASCVIVIPVYKNCTTPQEISAIRQAVRVWKGLYNICLCYPNGMYTGYYRYICDYDFDLLACTPNYFRGQNTYSWMCETYQWYQSFSQYKYMLLYQPDGWVFYDNLEYFINSNYDYIGGPWKEGYTRVGKEQVGNGGVSLRKISKFTKVCRDMLDDIDTYDKHDVDFEDLLFCLTLGDKLNIADVETGYQFCIDDNGKYWMKRCDGKLPMCLHGWEKHNKELFSKQVVEGKRFPNPYIGQTCKSIIDEDDVFKNVNINEETSYNDDATTFGTSNLTLDDVNDVIKQMEQLDGETSVEPKETVNTVKRNNKVIYTCITGGYDLLREPLKLSEGYDYICFTDNTNIRSNVWDIRPLPDDVSKLDNIRKQRYIKLNPQKYLSEYDISVWVDGSIIIRNDVNELVVSIDWDTYYIAAPQHPTRNCIYDELNACINAGKDDKDVMIRQIDLYKKLGMPKHNGLVQSNILIRRHNDIRCSMLMTLWSHEILTKSYRDQLSFNFCVWKLNQNILYLDKNLYNSKYFFWDTRHKGTIKIGIVNYNTQELLDALIKSINKFTPNSAIYIFDNSDKEPFVNTYANVKVLDNTKGQYINFDEWLEQYPNRFKSCEGTHSFGSAKHSISIQKMIEIIGDNFILMDSDILLKQDISPLFDPHYIYVGQSFQQPKVRNIYRVLPFICFLNVNMMKRQGINYFDERFMHGLYYSRIGDMYDTGGAFYLATRKSKYKEIHIDEYITHYKGGSWEDVHKERYNLTLSSSEWLEQNKNLWKDDI